MGLRREGLTVLFSSVGMGVALQFGLLKPQGAFIENIILAAAIALGSRALALFFGGRGK